MTTAVIETAAVTPAAHGVEVLIPLNKLKKSPWNARKTPHSETSIEAKAASIHAKGILQNLVVEPELDAEGAETGFYFVTIGEGRRLAQLLRAKRKQIKKTEPIRCVIDTQNDSAEISLDENVTREDLHPADQYKRFRELAENRGWGTLRRRELDAVGSKLAAETGLPHLKAAAVEHVAGTYRQSLTLSSGRFAMIDNGLGFQLVPWSREIDRKLGQHVAGVARAGGGIEWSLGRKRDLGL